MPHAPILDVWADTPPIPPSGQAVVDGDLDFICRGLAVELGLMSGKQLLITGGAGFLGYYLVQSVLHWNAISGAPPIGVTVLDIYRRGAPSWLTALATNPHLRVLTHDVTRPLPRESGHFDLVIHAASLASPTHYRQQPLETMDANVLGLRALLERSRDVDPPEGLLYFSSSEIYGDPPPEEIPTPETYRGNVSCTGPRACYDESKRFGETLAVTFAQQFGVPVTMARPFNNYGPGLRLDDRRLVADLARNVLTGEDLELLSDGRSTRTYCYVADAIIGYFKVLVRGKAGEAYNIGVEDSEISVEDLAARLRLLSARAFDYRGEIVRGRSPDAEYTTDNPRRRRPSIAKARAELGYAPAVRLDEGLLRTLVWYRDRLGDAA